MVAPAVMVAQQERPEVAVQAECLAQEEPAERVERRGQLVVTPVPEMAAPEVSDGIQRKRVRPEVMVALVVLVEPRQQVWLVTVVQAA